MQSLLSQYRWPFGIAVSLTIVVIVQMFVVYFALKSEPGLIRQNPYEAGLQYEASIRQMANAHESGITLSYKTQPISLNTFSLHLQLENLSQKHEVKSIELELLRPDSKYQDKTLILERLKTNEYQLPSPLESGFWLLTTRVDLADRTLLFKDSILLK